MDLPPIGWTTEAYVTDVIDGDTVEVEIKKTLRVRLLDVKAPEIRTRNLQEKEKGLQAKEFLEKLLPDGKKCYIFIPAAEKEIKDLLTLNRVLAILFSDDGDVCEEMRKWLTNQNLNY